jgi:anti-anti-sigma factor
MAELKTAEILTQEGFILARLQCAELDEPHARDMQEQITAASEQAAGLPVVLDLSPVRFVPSLSVGALVALLQKLKQRGQRLVLVGLQPPVRETLAICRLTKLFEIHDTLQEVPR